MNKHLKFIAVCVFWHVIAYFIWWCSGYPIERGIILTTVEISTLVMCFYSVPAIYDF